MGVSTDFLNPHNRLVVDEYHKTGTTYAPGSVSVEFLKFLGRKGIRPVLVRPQDLASGRWPPTRNSVKAAQNGIQQSTNSVLMVSPTAFQYNEEAAADNKFMTAAMGGSISTSVLQEFAYLYRTLTEVAGLQVCCYSVGHDRKKMEVAEMFLLLVDMSGLVLVGTAPGPVYAAAAFATW